MLNLKQPYFFFEPNPLDPANPVLHLHLYNDEARAFYPYLLPFRDALELTARLSQEVAQIALRSPEFRSRVKIKDVEMETPEDTASPADETPAVNSYKPPRGLLARILGRE
jgi:hypothetical protein